MEKPSLEVVLQALDALYRSENISEKEKASLWLIQLHSSVFAWEIADQLLMLRRDVETSYFAAQTMQHKVRFSFDELPAETHTALRDSLMNHLQQLCDAPVPVTRQLAMALADLALQMSGWTTVITDLVQRFGQNLSTISVLLDVLIVLPEEINNHALHLGHNRRKELREELGKNHDIVLTVLNSCLSHSTDITTKVYACMGSWAQLASFPEESLVNSSLIRAPFQTLKLLEVPQKLYEAAADCICSVLLMCEETSQYSLAQLLQAEVKSLLPVFQATVLSEDLSRAHCLCRIFTEMAESFLNYLVHQPNEGLGGLYMLDLLLECVSHYDFEVADITFSVWYRLSEELSRLNDTNLHQLFKPYIQKLIEKLCVHCQLDEDTSPTTVIDNNSDFTNFRKNVVELVRDVIFLVGSLECFNNLYSNICKPGTAWNVTEACLFVMYAVASTIRQDESEVLPIAVPVLLSLSPDGHYAVRATTLRLVGELADWINQHPDTLDSVLQFVFFSLNLPAVASFAAKAVQNVCLKCKQRMAPHIDMLLQIIQAADKLLISNTAILGLLKGTTEVLAKMSADSMISGVRSLCNLHTGFLQELNNGPDEAGTENSSSDPCVWLDRLAAIFRSSSMKIGAGQIHPCAPLCEELWPVLSSTCYKFKQSQRVIERTCRCFRFMIRSVGQGAAPILASLLTMCINIYRDHQHSCFLYLGSIVVDEFGMSPTYHEVLLQFLLVMAEITLPMLAAPNGLVDNPDTVDDLYRLCSRFLQHCPLQFYTTSVASTITAAALAATTLNHRDAFSSVMKYFRDLIHLSQGKSETQQEQTMKVALVETFISENGVTLLNALVKGFVNLPTVMLTDSAEVLWELVNFAREPVCQLLKNSVDQELTITSRVHVTPEQKAGFVIAISKSTSAEELLPTIKEFARLYK